MGDRDPRPGERCTCGRPATVVFLTDRGPVAWCGQEGASRYPVLPCPFCGSDDAHTTDDGHRLVCPAYRINHCNEED